MATQHDISEDEPVTLINIFEIPVEDVDGFIADWTRRARIMSTYPGFQDTRLHRALTPDGRFQLVNVAHWASLETYRTAHTDPESQASVRRVAREVSLTANPQLYRVAAGFEIPPGGNEPTQLP